MVKDPSGGDQTQEEGRGEQGEVATMSRSLDTMGEVGDDQADRVLTVQLIGFAEELKRRERKSKVALVSVREHMSAVVPATGVRMWG